MPLEQELVEPGDVGRVPFDGREPLVHDGLQEPCPKFLDFRGEWMLGLAFTSNWKGMQEKGS